MALELTEEQKAAGWQVMKLGDLCKSIDYGLTASATEKNTGTKFLRITDIKSGYCDDSSVPFVELSDDERRKYLLHAGDIVIARTGATTGISAWLKNPQNTVFASYLVRFAVKDGEHNSRFIGYLLKTDIFQRYIYSVLAEKSAQPNASATTIANAELPVPSRDEQDRIAEILGSVDDKIEANSRLIEKLTRLIDLQVEQAHRTASGTLKISDLAVHSKAQILPSKSTDASVLHYSLPAFDLGMVAAEEEAEAILSNKFILSEPAVLFSKLNPGTPRIWMVEPAQEKYSFASTEFVVLQPKEGIGLGTLWAACRDSRVSRRLIELARGTSTSHQRVSPQDILDSEVVLPDIPEAEAELIRQLIVQNNSLVKTRYLLIRHLIG